MIEQRQDDGGKREDEEDAKRWEREANVEDLHQGGEEDGEGMTVQDRQEQPIEDVPWHLFWNGLNDATAS